LVALSVVLSRLMAVSTLAKVDYLFEVIGDFVATARTASFRID
jgi:hypothetical protein